MDHKKTKNKFYKQLSEKYFNSTEWENFIKTDKFDCDYICNKKQNQTTLRTPQRIFCKWCEK
jgi:hypothetical protein